MITEINHWLTQQGLSVMTAAILGQGGVIIIVLLLGLLSDVITKRLLVAGLNRVIAHTETVWDDALLKHRFFNQLAHLVPAIVITLLAPSALSGYPVWIALTTKTLTIYMIVIGVLAGDAALNALMDIYQSYDVSREIPIKVFIQISKITIYFIGGIFVISVLLDETPLYLLSGLGALTAILILIFKDVILGFVAGIQLTANKMVSVGDWIEMPKYGADGDVLEVSLTTVKIQNWDKTITTIPTYALISESFKNWRGMTESGGRRIKRAIHIDIGTIRFCTDEMLNRFSKMHRIKNDISEKQKSLEVYNAARHLDDASIVNKRRLTNIGVFRAYVVAYLKNHSQIHQGMTFLVRQLAPTAHGLPIEIYVFCNDTAWENYEAIQADIFDHILSAVREFGLKVFQSPTGSDFKRLSGIAETLTENPEIR